jgi:hypothetical protein
VPHFAARRLATDHPLRPDRSRWRADQSSTSPELPPSRTTGLTA